MILQILTTAVDVSSSSKTYEVEFADGEFGQIKSISQPGAFAIPVTFRGVVYEYPQDIHDILRDVGREVKPDYTISVYEY